MAGLRAASPPVQTLDIRSAAGRIFRLWQTMWAGVAEFPLSGLPLVWPLGRRILKAAFTKCLFKNNLAVLWPLYP